LNSPESAALEKTAALNSEFLVRLFHSLFNPFARKQRLQLGNSKPWKGMLAHVGTLAVGYGSLGLVLRKVVQSTQKSKELETMGKLKAFSAARNPTLSIDPYLDDEEQEKGLENLGIPELPSLKAAGTDAGLPDKYAAPEWETTPYLALTAAAVIASGYGGWRLMDYLEDRKREKKLDKGILKTKNMIDKMVFDELQRTRSPQKAAALVEAGTDAGLPDKYAETSYDSRVGDGGEPADSPRRDWFSTLKRWTEGLTHGAASMYLVYAAATFALSYAAGKRYADNRDENRKRLKDLENVSEERAKVHEAPMLLDESADFSSFMGSPESPKSKTTEAVPVQGVKTKTPVDATDPYASILQ
jgi:hypothetical protein